MPAKPVSQKAPAKSDAVWIYNPVRTDGRGATHAANAVLHYTDPRPGVTTPIIWPCSPGLSAVPREHWEGAKEGRTFGDKTLREVKPLDLRGQDAKTMIDHTADGPSLTALSEMDGEIGELALESLESWGEGPRDGSRAILETLAAASGRMPKLPNRPN